MRRLAAYGVGGIGVTPAIIALVLYALLPVVRSTSVGLTGVDSAAIEAGRGMGMSPAQIFREVELPLALPVLLAGVRIVTVQAIGLAVVAALIGAGGSEPLSLRARAICRRSRAARRPAGDISRARRRFYAADPDGHAAPALCAMIEIDGVTKYYSDRRVVDGLSLTVPAGEFCVLLGPRVAANPRH